MPSLKRTSSSPDSSETKGTVLPQHFFRRDALILAEDLLGKVLISSIGGEVTSGLICETEAYLGVVDKASHAYGNRRTARTEVMYMDAGIAYVYFCYGLHHLFNVVCKDIDEPHAVLIRNIVPLEGISTMKIRRGIGPGSRKKLTSGPATVCRALGIDLSHNKTILQGPELWLEDRGLTFDKRNIIRGPRIGVDYAEEDATLPYRLRLNQETVNSFI